ncbi:FKBP-type peptidyl-prolyl cis-trans isomerase [Hymenobacter sp. B81]|uniref:FKBP-type peptidyl-prolyl cis-trans isomerase n=1 Tax=Hymenobacter sp. B81 TaxID=3344878 RepID=UPI0037DC927B
MRTLSPSLFSDRRWWYTLLLPLLLLGACKRDDSYAEFIEAQKKRDDAAIQAYITQAGIPAASIERRESGLYIVRKVAGTGPQVLNGKNVQAKYIGKFLDGRRFDSSYENAPAPLCQCFGFQVGAGSVIKAWDEAFLLLRKGDEVELLVPSHLGYGMNATRSIPANTPLRFEIIVTEVEQ